MKQVCRLLSVGRCTFYARCNPKPICHEHIRLKAVVRHVHRIMDATYGTRRMAVELCEWSFKVGRYKIRKLMKSLQLVAKRPKQHRYPMLGKLSVIAPNRLTDNSILTA